MKKFLAKIKGLEGNVVTVYMRGATQTVAYKGNLRDFDDMGITIENAECVSFFPWIHVCRIVFDKD